MVDVYCVFFVFVKMIWLFDLFMDMVGMIIMSGNVRDINIVEIKLEVIILIFINILYFVLGRVLVLYLFYNISNYIVGF